MPELIEAELTKRALERFVGQQIERIDECRAGYVRAGHALIARRSSDAGADVPSEAEVLDPATLVGGRRVEAIRRTGKVVFLDLSGDATSGGLVVALRFGMTGRVIVDGVAAIGELEYGPASDNEAWDRAIIRFESGETWRLNDPRVLGSVEVGPDERRLGPDAMVVTTSELMHAFDRSGALKAVLLDQGKVAGLGNLLVDESLWRTGLSPIRPARSVTADEAAALRSTLGGLIPELIGLGGSHRGELQPQRHRDGVCPLDGTPLCRDQVGGRTTYWCPAHQSSGSVPC